MEEPSLQKIEFEGCNWRKNLQNRTLRELKKYNVIDDKDEKIHISIKYKAAGNGFIGIINCNAYISDPNYLVFYNGEELIVIIDRFNLDSIYQLFKKSQRGVAWNAEEQEIWKFIISFTQEELYKKENPLPAI